MFQTHRREWFRSCLVAAFALTASMSDRLYGQVQDPFYNPRQDMVDQYVVSEGITNPHVLYAMRTVKRHEFVPRTLQKNAYHDAPLPIGAGQTISPPFIVAYMTESLDPRPEDKVLEIGTGSGYQAAVLAEICKEVYTIEIVESLGKHATERLKELEYENVHVKVGDGYKGWEEHAPYDKIIVTCSPEEVPVPLKDQLKEGGKMIIPLGERYQQVFVLLEKKDGELVEKKLIPTLFVPMTGISELNRKVQPNPLRPVVVNGSFEQDENEDSKPDNWHYQRQLKLFTDGGTHGKNYIQLFNLVPGRVAQALQGTAIDGRSLKTLQVRGSVSYENLRSGVQSHEQPGIMVHFFDSRRKLIEVKIVGPLTGSSDWKRVGSDFLIPEDAREMIITVGLNGGTGRLFADDIAMRALPR